MVFQVGMTPLMLACRLGHESMVDMLVNVFGAESDPADRVRWVGGKVVSCVAGTHACVWTLSWYSSAAVVEATPLIILACFDLYVCSSKDLKTRKEGG